MKHLSTIARVLLGLIFVVFGLNGFIGFIQIPEMTGSALAFMSALINSKMMMVVKGLEVVAGALLLLNKKIPLALTLLTPIVVVIFLFHIFMDPNPISLSVSVLALVMNVYLLWKNKLVFAPVLAA